MTHGFILHQGTSGHRERRSERPPGPNGGRNLVLTSRSVNIREDTRVRVSLDEIGLPPTRD